MSLQRAPSPRPVQRDAAKPAAPPATALPPPGVRLAAEQLFAGQRELVILHRGEEYRLRITRQDKLILTK